MIEIKQETADQVVGPTSERWLTELSNAKLRDVLALSANTEDWEPGGLMEDNPGPSPTQERR